MLLVLLLPEGAGVAAAERSQRCRKQLALGQPLESRNSFFSLSFLFLALLKLSSKKILKKNFWPSLQSSKPSRHRLLFAIAASLQQRRSVATTLASASQRSELKQRRSVAATCRSNARCSSAVATRVATSPRRCCDASCSSASCIAAVQCRVATTRAAAARVASLQCSATLLRRELQQPSLHRCSAAPSPAIAATAASSDVRRNLDFRWTSVLGFRPWTSTFVELPSCVLRHPLTSCRPIVLRPAPCCPTSAHLTSSFSSNIYLTSVQSLCVTGHSQQRTVFFKLYVVLEFCS